MHGFTSGKKIAAKNLALGLAASAMCWGGLLAERPALADGRSHYRAVGPVYRGPARPYYRRYFGPTYYGSVYYALQSPSFFPPAPPYAGYGPGSIFGNGYYTPMYGPYFGGNPYAGSPYSAYRPPSAPYINPYSNPALQDSMLENQLRWGMHLPPNAAPSRTHVRLRPSTPEQQAKSIHAQAQGDVYMRRLKFLNAYERYKVAMNAANDRPEPYFRLGYSLAAVGSFDSAVKYFKEGLELFPQWPAQGERLEGIFGDDNRLAILSLIERVTGWVRDDIRDPDRLFLVGVLLHFNGDNRANAFFEAAYRLAGGGDHLLAFLQPQPDPKEQVVGPSQPGPAQPGAPRGPYDNAPPPPAPVEPPLTLDQIPGAAMSPPGTNGPNPALSPRPPVTTNPVPPTPRRPRLPGGPLDQPPTNEGTPSGSPPRPTQPPSALPLPPLPAPAEPGPAPGPQSKPQPSAQTPIGGPELTPTVQSP